MLAVRPTCGFHSRDWRPLRLHTAHKQACAKRKSYPFVICSFNYLLILRIPAYVFRTCLSSSERTTGIIRNILAEPLPSLQDDMQDYSGSYRVLFGPPHTLQLLAELACPPYRTVSACMARWCSVVS